LYKLIRLDDPKKATPVRMGTVKSPREVKVPEAASVRNLKEETI
jgi:hypothetical protein